MILPQHEEYQLHADSIAHSDLGSANSEIISEPQQAIVDSEKEQHVWLIRYGKTDPGLIENVGNYDSDLHWDGIEHAEAIAQHIAASGTLPDHVFADPFLRCTHTADTIVSHFNRLSDRGMKVKIEEGLTEWQVPSLMVDPEGHRTKPRTRNELVDIFDTVDESYESVNPQGPDRDSSEENEEDASAGSPRFPETEDQLSERCKTSIDKILKLAGMGSVAIVSHAPCLQHLALALDGSPSASASGLGAWSLGGVTHFSRLPGETKWTLRSYSSTSHMPGEFRDGELGKWSLPSFVNI
jgi:broad specificity phosphatase PhoE